MKKLLLISALIFVSTLVSGEYINNPLLSQGFDYYQPASTMSGTYTQDIEDLQKSTGALVYIQYDNTLFAVKVTTSMYFDESVEADDFTTDDGNSLNAVAESTGAISTVTLLIASNDSTQKTKSVADFVCDGTNDEEELMQAFTDANGGKLILDKGTYSINYEWWLRHSSHVIVEGQGIGATIIRTQNSCGITADYGVISPTTSVKFVTFKDMTIDGNKYNNTTNYNGFLCANANHFRFERVEFRSFDDSCVENLDSFPTVAMSSSVFHNCRFTDSARGFYVQAGEHVRINNCYFANSGLNIFLQTNSYWNISDCFFQNTGQTHGIYINNAAYHNISDNIFHKTDALVSLEAGIYIDNTTDCIIEGNIIEGYAHGIYLNNNSTMRNSINDNKTISCAYGYFNKNDSNGNYFNNNSDTGSTIAATSFEDPQYENGNSWQNDQIVVEDLATHVTSQFVLYGSGTISVGSTTAQGTYIEYPNGRYTLHISSVVLTLSRRSASNMEFLIAVYKTTDSYSYITDAITLTGGQSRTDSVTVNTATISPFQRIALHCSDAGDGNASGLTGIIHAWWKKDEY